MRQHSVALLQDPPVLRPREVQRLPGVRALRYGVQILASAEGRDLSVWGCGLTHPLANWPRDVLLVRYTDDLKPTDQCNVERRQYTRRESKRDIASVP